MSKENKFRKVETFENHFEVFFVKLDKKVKDKVIWTLELIEDIEIIPSKYLKFLRNDIYEVRIKQGSNIYRVLCFFDKNKLVILMNGFQKKTQKTPDGEIEKAILIRKKYLDKRK